MNTPTYVLCSITLDYVCYVTTLCFCRVSFSKLRLTNCQKTPHNQNFTVRHLTLFFPRPLGYSMIDTLDLLI